MGFVKHGDDGKILKVIIPGKDEVDLKELVESEKKTEKEIIEGEEKKSRENKSHENKANESKPNDFNSKKKILEPNEWELLN